MRAALNEEVIRENNKKLTFYTGIQRRVLGVLKQKYTILQSILPITLKSDGSDVNGNTAIDKIVHVCCALVNLCPSIVPQEQ